MTQQIPRVPGVYRICCIPTGKIYIGSAVNIYQRWQIHWRSLRQGKHTIPALQEAWNTFGEAAFEFTVLELVDHTRRLEAEQRWIDQTRCFDPQIGFNRLNRAIAPGDSYGLLWEGFIDPQGNEVSIRNLYEFCREQGLSAAAMVALANPKHKLKQHRGWTHRNSPRKRAYIKTWEGFIDPEGNEAPPITNLKEFCRQNNLDATHMVAVLKGRMCSHKGWTHCDGRARQDERTYSGFIDPTGKRVTITNLTAFCRQNGLNIVHMFNLISGVRKSHKGWTWRSQDEPEAS